MIHRIIAVLAVLAAIAGCSAGARINANQAETATDQQAVSALEQDVADAAKKPKGGKLMSITVTSSAFKEGALIPGKYTCDDADVSPPIAWSGLPKETKSVCMINDDPDAPVGTWVHWVIYNIPADAGGLPEGVPPNPTLDNGAAQGTNDFKKIGYGGPCPPSGTHRYFFKVYALDTMLKLPPGATKAELLKAIKGHVIAEGRLMGKYQRR